jgi:hypothetical protein
MNPTIPAPNVMLMGQIGTGKTLSLGTLIGEYTPSTDSWKKKAEPHVQELFHIFTEPSMETLSELKCTDGYHYAYVPPANPSWDEMERSAFDINRLSLKALANREKMNSDEYGQFMQFLRLCHDFKCDRCGESFGDISTWDNTRALAVDSLSGLSIMAMDLVVGSKPVKSMSDWGIAMDRITRIVNKLCADTRCWFIMTAHLEMERDEITGRNTAMPSTLGRKLAPVLPRYFSEVIECVKEAGTFTWSTEAGDAATKTRNLKISAKLPPTFDQLVTNWKRKHAG